jgi:hypothetical protein
VSALVSAGLIDDFETGMAPHNWDARQFKSDVSTDRVKRFRKQAKTVSETVVEAPPEQNRAESDTEAEKKVSSETASPPRTQKAPPEDFLEFWKAYPTDPIMSRKEGLAQWNKLTPDERAAALAAVPAFVAHCRANPDYRPVHACRFLAQRRFDGFSAAAQPLALVSSGFYAAAGSKQLEAWQDHKFKTTGKSCPVDAKGGWTFPSEYPPSTREDAA